MHRRYAKRVDSMWKQSAVVLVLALGISASPGWAQEARAALGGRVTDAQGAVVPGATVTVISDDTGIKQQTTSNSQGNWIVEFLLPGRYQFTVAAAGFKTEIR